MILGDGGAFGTAKPAVFLSHSTKDKGVVANVCEAIEAAGIRCWVAPRDIPPGADWSLSILQAIDTCSVMVLVFSSHANTSKPVRREVELAMEKDLDLIQIRIEDALPSGPLEFFLRSQQWMDAFPPPLEPHLDNLVQVLRNLLERGILPPDHQPAPPSERSRMPSHASSAHKPHPQAGTFEPAVLDALQPHLARHVGPIAQRLIANTASQSPDYQSLCMALAEHIPEAVERRAFLNEVLQGHRGPEAGQHQVSETVMAHAVHELTHFLGPIARVIVMRTHKQCATAAELWEFLAAHIEAPSDRAAFLGTQPKV